ncbi:MAG: UDP-4-amino-4,6-dideoxy-N-acetyl-beta-L-altrosamine N-acetyltransferase [Chthoniobacter sp.]|nr:UDP-4-amino-4,6-dideoxy-N-acetyl-beta-L-altrosamine N-acetyltransferase [Chthoniobacter sp.]
MEVLAIVERYLREEGFASTLPKDYCFELLSNRHSADVVRWRNDLENRHAFFQARILTIEDQENYLKNYAERHRVDLILATREERRPIGVFTLKNLDSSPELGKLLGEKTYRGKGLASAATLALLHFGFEWLSLAGIWAHTQKINEANIRLNTKLGFAIESEIVEEGVAYWRMYLSRENFLTKAT